jgi:phage-related protein/DNA-binding transcriptional regulator YiaG
VSGCGGLPQRLRAISHGGRALRSDEVRAGNPLSRDTSRCSTALDVCVEIYKNTYKVGNSTEWSNEFYVDEKGNSPVESFLNDLDAKTRARFLWSMEQLRVRNVRARAPLVRQLVGKLWELREESDTNIFRVIYFFFSGRRIVFLHGFQKKTRRTPTSEIEVAKRRYEDFLAREKHPTLREAPNLIAEQGKTEGQRRYDEYWAEQMSDPDFRRVYEEEAARKELWLQLAEAREAAGLTQTQMAQRLGVSQAQEARLEKRGYDAYTLNSLRRYVEALGNGFSLEVSVRQTSSGNAA